MLLNQGYGRPKAEEEESRKGFILHRSLVFRDVDYGHIVEFVQKHGVGSLRPLPEGGVEVVTHGETADPAPEAAEETWYRTLASVLVRSRRAPRAPLLTRPHRF